jgi:hypothetical protein
MSSDQKKAGRLQKTDRNVTIIGPRQFPFQLEIVENQSTTGL